MGKNLTPIDVAKDTLLSKFSLLSIESVPLSCAAGRVLARDVDSHFDLPLFDNSSMDGFAVRSVDVVGATKDSPILLRVVADIPAGEAPTEIIRHNQAARIMTGAALPAGADAVVRLEDTDVGIRDAGSAAPDQVEIFFPAPEGENVRPSGEDVCKGELVLTQQRILRPQEIGVLAMLGLQEIEVYRQPRLGLMSPGDELLPLGAKLEGAKIFESNSYVLEALIKQMGGETLRMGIVPDNLDAVRKSLDEAIEQGVDLFLSTGGVSVGAFDYVRALLEKEGELTLWRVNMRPGKPLAFGSYRDVPYFGLPGNPVSAYIGFQVFVRPAIRKMLNLPEEKRAIRKVRLLENIESDGRESYMRVFATFENGEWVARLTGHQGSGNLRSLVNANALLIVPSGETLIEKGSQANAWFFEGLDI